ncbi:protocadherin beta-13 [Octopus bimaculoides]|uniref:protocadherin beta-13 n=1 Tax=Octopus bimaculoides TaxID=37653 RepID=UPI00071DCA14|nr:protocadherin beta-13 [Octopus bimaculoides]|eukprot:XP_014789593.1 PREDICTED: protocadherin beta-13-like [Octopus bimaculoides]
MWLQVCIFLFLLRQSNCMESYYVNEEEPPGTFVGDIADSLPQQDKSNIVFEMLQGKSKNLFRVTKSGKVYTLQKLDAEALCSYNAECYRTLDVTIKSDGTVKYVREIKIIINDIDDNKPIFPKSEVNLHFSEADGKGMKKPIINAMDKDISIQNSEIKYEINKGDDAPFSLDISKKVDGTSQLKIVLDEQLDRETKNTHMIQVIAKGSRSSEEESILKIKIDVLDFNDNPPVFMQKKYNFSIGNTVRSNMPIAAVSATDADSGMNSKISYRFSSKTLKAAVSHFKLNEESGEIFLNTQISKMKQKSYQLYIEATDGGSPALSSDAIVWVFVTNQENNAPHIEVNFITQSNNTLTISENIPVDSFLAYVKISDNDKGKNGDVHCGVKHDYFYLKDVDENRYTLKLKKEVDRESTTSMSFKITCQDKGSPPLSAEKKFSVHIVDVNDVPPQFTKSSFTFITYENGEKGFPIGFVNVSDPDSGPGGEVSYSLKSETNRNFPFHISNFGFISTTQSLDREQCDIYRFKVLAKDNGTPSLTSTANITVEIVDVNDNAPYFTFPSRNLFNVEFNYYPGSSKEITTLRASDRDSHVNAFLKYEILGGNAKKLFKVNPYTGVLSFAHTVNQNDAGSYDLKLAVKDKGKPVLSATTTLKLKLTVSNKTLTTFTAASKIPDNSININLFIIIIVAAVIVSLVLVISITLCIVKRNDQRNIHYSTVMSSPRKYPHTNKHIEYFHKQLPHSDTPVTMPVMCRRQSLPGFQSDHNWSDPGIHYHTLKEGRPKINIQRTTTSPDTAGDKETKFTSPYCYSDLSTISYADSGRGYSEGYTTHYEELPDPYLRRQETHPEEETPKADSTLPRNNNTGTMPCPKLPDNNVDTNTDENTKLKSFSPDSTFQQLPLKNSFSSTNKPLPAIPNVP